MPLQMTVQHLDSENIFLIKNFLSQKECETFIAQSEQSGYEEATVTTAAGMIMRKDIRDNDRLIIDDHDLAQSWWNRAKDSLPKYVREWQTIGFNERFRFYRYDVGQKFSPHFDGSFYRDNGETSQLTFMVYLNDDFQGGETKFYHGGNSLRLAVKPERGAALVFVHRQLHEGAPIESGKKYVLRTDVMCKLKG